VIIDLNSVFNAIVGYYDEISPRLIESALEQDDQYLIRARSSDKPIFSGSNDPIFLGQGDGKLSHVELHCLQAAYSLVVNFVDPTILDLHPIEDKFSSCLKNWAERERRQPFHALTPYLAIAGMRDIARQLGMIDRVEWPDVTALEQKIGMTPSGL
jgi:hypothetical protein